MKQILSSRLLGFQEILEYRIPYSNKRMMCKGVRIASARRFHQSFITIFPFFLVIQSRKSFSPFLLLNPFYRRNLTEQIHDCRYNEDSVYWADVQVCMSIFKTHIDMFYTAPAQRGCDKMAANFAFQCNGDSIQQTASSSLHNYLRKYICQVCWFI